MIGHHLYLNPSHILYQVLLIILLVYKSLQNYIKYTISITIMKLIFAQTLKILFILLNQHIYSSISRLIFFHYIVFNGDM